MDNKPILIVEDDLGISESLQEYFESEGYPVFLAKHGQAALDLLEMSSTPKPGLIFVDLMMPVMDGFTFLSELQGKHPIIFAHTPIFVMSARADTQKLQIKTTGLVIKPFELEELAKIAARYCGTSAPPVN